MIKLIERMKDHPLLTTAGSLLVGLGIVMALRDSYRNELRRRTPVPWRADLQLPLERALRSASSRTPVNDRSAVRDEVVTTFVADYNLRPAEVAQVADEFFRRYDHGHESLMRGGDLFGQRRFEEAKREYESAVQIDPENTGSWSALGAVSMMLGDRESARVAYDRALTLAPEDWQLQYNYGLFFARTGRPVDSLKYLKPALAYLRADPNRRKDLDAVLRELTEDEGLAELRRQPGYRELVSVS